MTSVLAAAGLSDAAPVCGPGTRHAGVVVRLSPTDERSFCVSLKSESISGMEALRLTGLPVEAKTESIGELVCKIGAVGVDVADCPSKKDNSYWSYWHGRPPTGWHYAETGASAARLSCGQVDGWAWLTVGANGAGGGPGGAGPSQESLGAFSFGTCANLSVARAPQTTSVSPYLWIGGVLAFGIGGWFLMARRRRA